MSEQGKEIPRAAVVDARRAEVAAGYNEQSAHMRQAFTQHSHAFVLTATDGEWRSTAASWDPGMVVDWLICNPTARRNWLAIRFGAAVSWEKDEGGIWRPVCDLLIPSDGGPHRFAMQPRRYTLHVSLYHPETVPVDGYIDVGILVVQNIGRAT